MKSRTLFKANMIITVLGVILFAAIVVWFFAGIGSAREVSSQRQLEGVKQSVINGAVLCYSVEGFYPDSLDYLREYYGIRYDENRYIVYYRYISSDISPSVTVYERKLF